MPNDFEGVVDTLPDEAAPAPDAATEEAKKIDTKPEDGKDPPEPGPDPKPEEAAAAAAGDGDGDGDGDAGDKPDADPDGETRSQRRRRQRREHAEQIARDHARLVNRVAQLEEKLGKLAEPSPDDFENPDDYIAERAAYTTRKAAIEDDRERAEADAKSAKEAGDAVMLDGYKEAAAEARTRYADFDKVAHGDHWTPTQPMLDVIFDSDRGPDLAYYLGSNPEEADRIARLTPARQAAELGRIEATKLPDAKPKPKPQTKAPPPIKPISNAAPAAEKSPAEMSPAEYRAWRTKKAS